MEKIIYKLRDELLVIEQQAGQIMATLYAEHLPKNGLSVANALGHLRAAIENLEHIKEQ